MSYIPQGGTTRLDFSLVNSEVVGQRVEQKFCEECGRPFCRPAVAVQKGAAEVLCARCMDKQAARLVREAEEHREALQLGRVGNYRKRHGVD